MSRKVIAFKWVWDSPIGEVAIMPYAERGVYKYGVFFNGECGGGFESPEAAANNVYCRASGNTRVDELETAPGDLSEWERVPVFE